MSATKLRQWEAGAMTKRDFELIAKAFKDGSRWSDKRSGTMSPPNIDTALEAVAYALSNALLDTNPRFDQVRFLSACGVIT